MEHHKERIFASIDLKHIEHNIQLVREKTGSDCKLTLVIKANGYGHGAVEIARHFESFLDVYGYAVATAEEAIELREAGILKPILILGYVDPAEAAPLIEKEVSIAVFRIDTVRQLSEIAMTLGKAVRVHIKVDTGMSRIGIPVGETGFYFMEQMLSLPGISLEGMFTHFARADEADKTSAYKQLEEFKNFLNAVEQRFCIQIPIKHCANSAAIMDMPESYMDMIRLGIAMYGLWPSEEMKCTGMDLRPALNLFSRIVYIKEIPKGTPVSYGGTFTAKESMRIATIPVGYADGYPRSLSNKGYVLIHGQKAPILGRICMDQFMVDVTHIPEAKEDDPVTLVGESDGLSITMEELGALSGRFNYEFACDLGRRVKRIYRKN